MFSSSDFQHWMHAAAASAPSGICKAAAHDLVDLHAAMAVQSSAGAANRTRQIAAGSVPVARLVVFLVTENPSSLVEEQSR